MKNRGLSNGALESLITALDRSATGPSADLCCRGVKEALVSAVNGGSGNLDPGFLTPTPDGYARRLLHLDPARRYSVLVMVWGPGQGTPIHDHEGRWCVECVCLGRIKVTSYRIEDGDGSDRYRFSVDEEIVAGVGEAGALIPPFEHHVIENPYEDTAATIHVYRGEMRFCSTFEPTGDGTYRRRVKRLEYTT